MTRDGGQSRRRSTSTSLLRSMSLLRISSSAAAPNSAWYADPMWATTSCTRQPVAALCVCQSASERSRQNATSSERSRRNAPTGSMGTRIPYGNPLNRLGRMAWIKITDVGERDELLKLVRRAPRDGLEQEADVVADVVATQHHADEPPGSIVEDRQPGWARMPSAAGEFIDPVAGFAAE